MLQLVQGLFQHPLQPAVPEQSDSPDRIATLQPLHFLVHAEKKTTSPLPVRRLVVGHLAPARQSAIGFVSSSREALGGQSLPLDGPISGHGASGAHVSAAPGGGWPGGGRASKRCRDGLLQSAGLCRHGQPRPCPAAPSPTGQPAAPVVEGTSRTTRYRRALRPILPSTGGPARPVGHDSCLVQGSPAGDKTGVLSYGLQLPGFAAAEAFD